MICSIGRHIQQSEIKDVKFLEKIGEGAFSIVNKVEVKGKIYAGKRFRTDRSFDEKRFFREFQIMQKLEHDHIVKYYGYHLAERRGKRCYPVLIMECLETNLHNVLLSDHQPLTRKLNLLYGIAQGLAYLHSKSVIHRDLTAKNVLLDLREVPKISDFGNSCVPGFDLGSELHSQSLTQCPGTLNYMAPEALSSQNYGTEIDIFSFGHLSLFVSLQIYPERILSPNIPEGDESDDDDDSVRGRNEVQRRQEFFTLLYEEIDETHALVHLIKKCLSNRPKRRPKAEELISQLGDMCKPLPPPLSSKKDHPSTPQRIRK